MIDAKTAREGTKSIRSNTIRFVLDSVSVQIENAMKAGRYAYDAAATKRFGEFAGLNFPKKAHERIGVPR